MEGSERGDTPRGTGLQRNLGKIAAVVGAVASVITIAGVTGVYPMLKAYFGPAEYDLSVLPAPVHLGDNIHANFGGDASRRPVPSSCTEPLAPTVAIFCLDKSHGTVKTVGPATTIAQHVFYSEAFTEIQSVNMDAWRHVAYVPYSQLTLAERNRFVPFGQNALVWRENRGQFYEEVAPFLVSAQITLPTNLSNRSINLDDYSSGTVKITFQGLTGGKRADQTDRIFVFFNQHVAHVDFPNSGTRESAEYSHVFPLDLVAVRAGKPSSVGVFVLPWQEKGPLPPPEWKGDRRGPAHFQDTDINQITVHVELRR